MLLQFVCRSLDVCIVVYTWQLKWEGACNCFDVCKAFKIQFKHTCKVLAKTVQAEIKKYLLMPVSSAAMQYRYIFAVYSLFIFPL